MNSQIGRTGNTYHLGLGIPAPNFDDVTVIALNAPVDFALTATSRGGTGTQAPWYYDTIHDITYFDNSSRGSSTNYSPRNANYIYSLGITHSTGVISVPGTINTSLLTVTNAATLQSNLTFTSLGASIRVKEGSNAKQGTAQLNGTTAVVVSTTACVSTNVSRIWLTIQTPNGTIGAPYVSAVVAATSFSIKSTAVGDNSTVAWLITDSN